MDYLIRELSTPRCKYYVNRLPYLVIDGQQINDLPYDRLFDELTNGLKFRPEHPGDHINIWDCARLEQIGKFAGFERIIRSKPGGSVAAAMQGSDMDRTHRQMSLYYEETHIVNTVC